MRKTMSTELMQTVHLAEIRRAAWALIEQVDQYTMRAGFRSMLLNARNNLARVLDASTKAISANENKTERE